MTPPKESWAIVTAMLGRVKGWLGRGANGVAPGPGELAPESAAYLESRQNAEVKDSSDLLKRRMNALHLRPEDLSHGPGRMLGVRTGLCARCEARGKCMAGLADEFADPDWGDWRNYCPNATALTILATLHDCTDQEEGGPALVAS